MEFWHCDICQLDVSVWGWFSWFSAQR